MAEKTAGGETAGDMPCSGPSDNANANAGEGDWLTPLILLCLYKRVVAFVQLTPSPPHSYKFQDLRVLVYVCVGSDRHERSRRDEQCERDCGTIGARKRL